MRFYDRAGIAILLGAPPRGLLERCCSRVARPLCRLRHHQSGLPVLYVAVCALATAAIRVFDKFSAVLSGPGEAIRTLDMGLLMGGPLFQENMEALIARVRCPTLSIVYERNKQRTNR